MVAAHIISYLPFPGFGLAGDLALYALGEQSAGEMAAGMALGLVPGGKLASLIGKIGSSAWRAAKHYAITFGAPVLKSAASFMTGAWVFKGISNLAGRARDFVRRIKPCHCFAASTLVWTTSGLVPIGEISVGDVVIAVDDATGEASAREVEAVAASRDIFVVVLVVKTELGVESIRTTADHPVLLAGGKWSRVDTLRPGTLVAAGRGHATVVGLQFTDERERVYDLTIRGTPTFLVGDHGVVVHNCDLNIKVGHIRGGKLHDHNWERLFGRRPSDRELTDLAKKVFAEGSERIQELKGDILFFEKGLVVNGRTVVIRGALPAATNRIDINTAWVE